MATEPSSQISIPALELPKGGGAIQGLNDTFAVNQFNGMATFSIPLPLPEARALTPKLGLSYNSSDGNGIFGMGFSPGISAIGRNTSLGMPAYRGNDIFTLTGAGNLVPKLDAQHQPERKIVEKDGVRYAVTQYMPDNETSFQLIFYWENVQNGLSYWEVTDPDNTQHTYGKDASATISNPANPQQIFQWNLQESRDAKGNRVIYSYAVDRSTDPLRPWTNTYLMSVSYGNYPNGAAETFAFEVSFVYDDKPPVAAFESLGTGSIATAPVRQDAFSSFKAGFEIRTEKRCQSVLVSHYFIGQYSDKKILTRSLTFQYADGSTQPAGQFLPLSLLEKATLSSHVWDESAALYHSKDLPPIELTYTPFAPEAERSFHTMEAGGDLPIPGNFDEFQLVDLHREGLPGILFSQPAGHLYWEPEGNGKYAFPQTPREFPTDNNLDDPVYTLMDIDGNGGLELVVQDASRQGYYQYNIYTHAWDNYVPFPRPVVGVAERDKKLVDLDGNGRQDILITAANSSRIFFSEGTEGFRDPVNLLPLEDLPYQYNDSAQELLTFATIFGDGLSHYVRVRNGQVDCWPNLGHGKFGNRISLANAPVFEQGFDKSRMYFTDVDGSGTADIAYVYSDRVAIYLNLNGNSFAAPFYINLPDTYTRLDGIRFSDILGSGFDSLVFTKMAPAVSHFYYDMLEDASGKSVKPYLLEKIRNNLGAARSIQYASSTSYYLRDKKNGRPWITALPFPVQVVSSTVNIDEIEGWASVQQYAYHDGYYDPLERQFAGFGFIESWDGEPYDQFRLRLGNVYAQASDQYSEYLYAPVSYTKSWYVIGGYGHQDAILQRYQSEYFKGDPDIYNLPPSAIAPDINRYDDRTMQHVYQVLSGKLIHAEVYGPDGINNDVPFTITQSNYLVKQVQERAGNRYPVFQAVSRENLNYNYDRAAADPRVEHELTLETNEYGNPLENCKIFYPRRSSPYNYPGQEELKALAGTSVYNEAPAEGYIIGVVCETRSFEVPGLTPVKWYFTFEEAKVQVDKALADKTARLLDWQRNYFWNEAQDTALPLREVTQRLLLHHQQSTVFEADYIENLEINGNKVITEKDLLDEGGYLLDDGYYWNAGMAGQYYKEEDNKYFMPYQTDNAYQTTTQSPSLLQKTKVYFDDYMLLPVKQVSFLKDDENAPENHVVLTENNYIFLKPWQLTDINGNISQLLYNTLGQVAVTTQFKPDELNGGELEGDKPVTGYDTSVWADISLEKVVNDPKKYIQQCSSFFYYDTDSWMNGSQPASFIQLSRELFVTGDPSGITNIFQEISYNDGFGRTLETKILTAPGAAFIRDQRGMLLRTAAGRIMKQVVDQRWIVSGKVIYNNKGKTALDYQSYYSNTFLYEEQAEIAEELPPPHCIAYDAVDRAIKETSPKAVVDGVALGFFTRTVFRSWETVRYDKNDTVTDSGYYKWFMANYPVNPTQEQENEKDALEKAAVCENTPAREIMNSQGNTIFKIAANLGKVLEADVRKIVDKLPLNVQDEIWLLFKTDYLDSLDYLNEKFRPYDPGFKIDIPADLKPYEANILDVQYYLASGCLTSAYTLDIKGRTLCYTDPRLYYDNVRNGTDYYSAHFQYGMTSSDAIFSERPDSGQQLGIANILDSIFKKWGARGFLLHTTFDKLQREISLHVSGTEITPANPPSGWKPLVLDNTVKITTYGEGAADAQLKNLFGQVSVLKDQAGKADYNSFTITGKPVLSERRLLKAYKEEVNWDANPELETEVYRKGFTYTEQKAVLVETDYLGTGKVFEKSNSYNESGALITVDETTYGPAEPVVQNIITAIEYYPNRQPVSVHYGNGMRTAYTYEFTTQRMTRIETAADTSVVGTTLQSIQYTYDPQGNITRTTDNSFEPVACYGQGTDPVRNYWYDPLYQLLHATGRQNVSLNGNSYINGFKESAFWNFCPGNPADANTLAGYRENYQYDYAGNMLQLQHITNSTQGTDWTRNNAVNKDNNQLTLYTYDRNGNQLSLYENSATPLAWNYRNQPSSATQLQRPDYVDDAEYYTYDASGNRLRRVIESLVSGNVHTEEYIYLEGWNIKRKKTSAGVIEEERYTRQVLAEKKLAAIIYYWAINTSRKTLEGTQQTRFQLNDLQASVAVEVDTAGARISYEEYFPFGESAFIAGVNEDEVKLKYYRFTGKERDDTTGLYYFGARYYASWLGRWISTDPQNQFASPYTYSYNNPTTATDPDGQWAWLIPIVVGGLVSAYTAYSAAKSSGTEGAKLAAVTVGGAAIGMATGGLGGYVAAAGIPLANTVSTAVTSTVSSYALNKLTNGVTNVTTSIGVASYNWSTGEKGFLFKPGQSYSQQFSYAMGALANIQDIRAAMGKPGNVILVTENEQPIPYFKPNWDWIGHSAIVDGTPKINVSVGPMKGYFPQPSFSLAFWNKLHAPVAGKLWANYFNDPHGWHLPINNIDTTPLLESTADILKNQFSVALPYSGLGNSCVDYTSRALWNAGVYHIPGWHPYFLHGQMFIRAIGISGNPFITGSNSQPHPHEE